MSERQPYSRVYWSIRSDPKFRAIYPNSRCLGTWLKLLILADAIHPEPADIPAKVPSADFRALVEAGIVDDVGGGQYRIHGLDAERDRRRLAATVGRTPHPSATQTGPRRDPDGSQAKPSLAKPRQDEPSIAREDSDPADAYWSLTGTYPTGPSLKWIDDLAGQYGQEPTTRALVRAHVADAQRSTLLGRTKDILASEARALDRKERDDERERVRQKRAAPKVLPEWEQEFRKMIAERYGRDAA